MEGCFGGRRPVGKLRDSWNGCYWERCCRFAPVMEPDGSNKEQRMLDVEGQGGHGPKTGQSVIVEEEEVREGDSSL